MTTNNDEKKINFRKMKMQIIVGIDIGGTKCAVSFAKYHDNQLEILDKVWELTKQDDFNKAVEQFIHIIRSKLEQEKDWHLCAIGISCGGPLNSKKGLILAPPNLPYWDQVDIYTPLKVAFHVPVAMQNDADACALAEWKLGAGQGTSNMIFLTFGTGMGAGLILNNQLYTGCSNMAGEVGHIRLQEDGPFGYGKNGSFEGFCSGGGIADLGKREAKKAILEGNPPCFCKDLSELSEITAKKIAEALIKKDSVANQIYQKVGKFLGRGLSVLIDILNPERIILGSIFYRQQDVLEPIMWEVIKKEALAYSYESCQIVPAALGEMLGDYAALSVGMNAYLDACK